MLSFRLWHRWLPTVNTASICSSDLLLNLNTHFQKFSTCFIGTSNSKCLELDWISHEEMQTKTTMRQIALPIHRMATVNKVDSNKCCWGYGEIGPLTSGWREWKTVRPLWKRARHFLKSLNIQLSLKQESPLLGISREFKTRPRKNLYVNVYGSTIIDSQKVETPRMLVSWWLQKGTGIPVQWHIIQQEEGMKY